MGSIDPDRTVRGLHQLKKDWVHKSFLERYCLELMSNLDEALEATFLAAPHRSVGQTYRLRPPEGSRLQPGQMGDSKVHVGPRRPSEERLLEAALFAKYGLGEGRPAASLWACLVGYQIPLFDSRARKGWGHIDLLGLSESGEPVIVELKRGGSGDTPLHALLEAGSYAVALSKNWEMVASELGDLGIAAESSPATWNLVLLAPQAYWDSWSPRTRRGSTVPGGARDAYRQLCDALASRGMPVGFGLVDGLGDWSGATELNCEGLVVSEVEIAWFADEPT